MISKISLIGLGYIGKIHLKLLKESKDWNLTGVYDHHPELTKELADTYGIKAYSSLEEAIEDADAIDIATPSKTHFEIARKAIIAGKHVFIEKPVTSDLNDARLLESLVKEAGVVCQVGHVERFNPAFTAAVPYIKEPAFIEVHRLSMYNPRGTDVSVVLDLMMHDIDLILKLVKSNVKEVQAVGSKLVSDSADIANARVLFENGCVANLTTNRVSLKNSRKLKVFTSDCLVNVNLLDKITEVVKIQDAVDGSNNYTLDPGHGRTKKEFKFEHPIILPVNAINEELHAFYTSVNSKKAIQVGIDDAIRSLEIAFMIEDKLS